MKARNALYAILFTALTAGALSTTTLAAGEEGMEDDAPVSTTDQNGMASKDETNSDAIINKGDEHDSMGSDSMGSDSMGSDSMNSDSMSGDATEGMDESAPNSSTDQEGMESKDTTNME